MPAPISLLAIVSGLALAPPAPPLARELGPGQTIDTSLTRGETVVLAVTLPTDTALAIVVEQHGADVALVLAGPGGEEASIDVASRGTSGDEPATIGGAPGRYTLSIRGTEESPITPGRVVIRSGSLVPRGADATARIEAERALSAAAAAVRDAQSEEANARALEQLERAAALWSRLGDRYWAAVSGMLLAEARAANDPSRSLEGARAAAETFRSLDRRGEQARALRIAATALSYAGQSAASVAPALEAVAILRETGDALAEAQTLNDLGGSYVELGDVARSREVRERALELARSAREPRTEAAVLADLGATYWFTGAVEDAVDLFVLAGASLREQGNRLGQAATEHNIGVTHLFLGEADRAEASLRAALPLCRDAANKPCEASVLQTLALALDVADRPDEARPLYAQARAIRRALGDEEGEAWLLVEEALGHRRRGERDLARSRGEEAEAIYARTGSGWKRALLLDMLGELRAEDGDTSGARASHEATLALRRAVEDRQGQAVSLIRLGRLDHRDGRLEAALERFEDAVRLLEGLRGGVQSVDRRMAFVAGSSIQPSLREAYWGLIDVQMELHRKDARGAWSARAFQASEAAHARVLLEMLAQPRDAAHAGARRGPLAELRALQDRFSLALDQQVRGAGRSDSGAELERVAREMERVRARLRAEAPHEAAWALPRSLDVAAAQAGVLDPDSLLLEFALGEERSYLWAVTPTSLASFELPSRAEIEKASRAAHQAVATDGTDATVAREALGRLSRMILGPVAPLLGRQRLLVVADGALHYVPFAALPHPDAPEIPLVERHEIVCLPSASTLAVLREGRREGPPPTKDVAVLADPVFSLDDERLSGRARPAVVRSTSRAVDAMGFGAAIPRLPFTRREAHAIRDGAPAGAVLSALDFDASRATLVEPRLASYRVLHIATHGVLNAERPELSGILLSLFDRDGRPQPGFVTAADAARLRLSADLVVLSGCRTALGREVNGEGIVGLARGFLYAGAPRVMASLWKVDDAATATLMKRLYESLLRERRSPAAALRAAQLEVLRQRRYQHPYYWAGFQLYGEAR